MDFMPQRTVSEKDAVYPQNLRDAGIKSYLYVLGTDMLASDRVYVGVIGCRKPSVYGQVVTQKVVAELVYNKCVIVSGFMYGIDMEAHNAAIECGGSTVCVLGYGLEYLQKTFPKPVLERFAFSGAFVTEYEYNVSPKKWTFAKRNKIIAGFCSLLIVIEAEQQSGSFITCYWANKFNREVYAVPGSILSEKSVGTNKLIKKGTAQSLLSVSDLTKVLGNSVQKDVPECKDAIICQAVLSVLRASPLGYDQLVEYLTTRGSVPICDVASLISSLELSDTIKRKGNIYYVS